MISDILRVMLGGVVMLVTVNADAICEDPGKYEFIYKK